MSLRTPFGSGRREVVLLFADGIGEAGVCVRCGGEDGVAKDLRGDGFCVWCRRFGVYE